MELIENLFRNSFFFLDGIIYSFIVSAYNLFVDIAETSIFTEEIIDLFASKVYALLGIFMLFKVSFSIITYIVSPDDFLDKNKGFGKLISNIIITLTLLVATPWIFNQAMDIQKIILKDNIIGKIFSTSGVNTTVVSDPGNVMAYETFRAFYRFDFDSYPECSDIGTNSYDDIAAAECKRVLDDDYDTFYNTLHYAGLTSSIDIYLDQDLLNEKDASDNYYMKYDCLISTAAGVLICLLLIVFCFDVAVRSVKLGFLRMIAPVPIVSRVDPKGKGVFDKWLKTCVSTYLDLFIRLLAIYFAVFVITQVIDLRFIDAATGLEKEVSLLVKVFIILGALLFAKQLPQLIQDLTGIKMDGKFTLNPLKKLGEVPGVEKVASTLGGTVAGVSAGARVGNPLLGGLMGFAKGFSSAKLIGDGKGGFMAGANSTYKSLMGKDFINFQFKPGGKTAVDEISNPLKQAYGIRTEFERQLNVVTAQTSDLATELSKNGIDVNGDLNAQSSAATSNLSQLNSSIKAMQNKVINKQIAINNMKKSGLVDKNKLRELTSELQKAQADLSGLIAEKGKNESIINDISSFQNLSAQEIKIRTALSKVEKDISDLSTEKKQRENFYGVDPSPAPKVAESLDRVGKGTSGYL